MILNNWTTFNAILIIIATPVSFYFKNLLPICFVAIMSFLILFYLVKNRFQTANNLTMANFLTGIRLISVLLIAYFYKGMEKEMIAVGGMFILIADGIDGKLARYYKNTSEFGEYFDKETDALYLHILGLVAIFKQLIWPWIVVLGLLRYIFALILLLNKKGIDKERRSKIGRYIFVIVILSQLSIFVLSPLFYQVAIIIASTLLFFSFGRDFLWLFSKK